MFKSLNLRTKFLISMGLVVLMSLSLVIAILSMNSVEMAKTLAYQVAEETARNNSNFIQAELEASMDTVRTLSYTFQEVALTKGTKREVLNNILINVLKDNPKFFGAWTLWEPNALDGKDSEYINKPGYDGTGRFIPYWSRLNGQPHLEPLVNYSIKGAGEYYLIPRETKRETIMEPYYYPVAGKDVLLTSVVVPLVVNNTFVGVVGVDITLDTIQKVVSEIRPLEIGYARLLSNQGKYVAHNEADKIGKTMQNLQGKEAVRLGESYTTTRNGVYEIYLPISVGRTSAPWSMVVGIPVEEILSKANSIRDFAIVIGVIALIIMGFVIYQVASSITNRYLMAEIRERSQIEEKALRFASIVESTDDGIIGMDPNGIILDWNRGAERIFGYLEREIVGKSIMKLIPQDKQCEFDEILCNILSQSLPMTHYETISQRKDGQLINVYYTVSPIKDHFGKIVGASNIIKDVTAERKLEKEMIRMDQMALVGEMAASIGHEVRNPMTTVRGFLQLLGEQKNTDKYSEYIPLMISELDRANAIISEFLSISRTKTTEFARQNLNDIIECILPLIQAEATSEEKLIKVELTAIPDLFLDHKEIRQVILNLTRNGLEAMDIGGCLTIRTFLNEQNVVLAIQDEGEGISPEVIDRLGTPFLTTKDKGTGLGLAVCFGIAARHNAKITAQTGKQGTTFLMKFALKQSDS
ncbi:PAS domain S-box [Desulfosporosinus orientis DSM 765]|uniref:histidine kinase n=1 Tax=Desulfosporosinus orientis (strain ATCC 19365 / DSM 765 / NCIMB 8382 / VKM B-1628 / Singapore I) TaxID=768706 RepID=G7WFY0_DESOD|nr:PAS domain S-box protein [Desulfosporosinus orientis]AET69495.1 PAS domain S-box [Desulfosporosinus orientis DSM 765]